MNTPRKKRGPSRLPRAEWLIGLTAVVIVLFVGWLAVQVVALSRDLRDANQARDALAAQVQSLGESPVAGPPGSRGEPGQSVTGPIGDKGDKGDPGPAGPTGPPGPSGTPGTDGSDGAAGIAGEPGEAGASGVAGQPGPAGPQGEPGPQGPQGEQGERGPAGPACPDGYSLQAPDWDPDALVCRRDGAPQPEQPGNGNTPQALALDPQRRQYM